MSPYSGSVPPSGDFDGAILVTINEVFSDIFSRRSVETIYRTMEDVYSLRREEIPGNLERFSSALAAIVGKGHLIIEDLLVENLYVKKGVKYESKKGYDTDDYIEELRSRLSSR
jgi:hypothetical protein